MENGHPAFLAGEYVRVRSRAVLEEIEQQFGGEKDWKLNPHSLFAKNMADYAGLRLQIVAVSFYHLGIVLYELREIGGDPIPGHWLEKTLVDQELERADEAPVFQVADRIYRIIKTIETIEIQDGAGIVYCVLRKHNVDSAFDDISRVASLRCAISFSSRYNFDGIEYKDFQNRMPDNK